MDLYFYYANEKYINFLKKVEKQSRGFTCVPNVSYWNTNKFVFGAVLNIKGISYFVPVSSYSKNQQDVLLMKDKKTSAILGSLRFAYMIPIPDICCKKMDINSLKTTSAIAHVSKELAFCRRNRDKILKLAEKTYNRVVNKADDMLVKNSCDFKLLEKAYTQYCRDNDIEIPKQQEDNISKINFYKMEITAHQLDELKKSNIPFQSIEKNGKIAIRFDTSLKDTIQNILKNLENTIAKK